MAIRIVGSSKFAEKLIRDTNKIKNSGGNKMKRPEVFYKMKAEKESGKLTQIPNLHPSSKHEPDPNCDQCQGTGWLIYPLNSFKVCKTTYQYDGHDTTFCACTFFTDDVKELATEMISSTVGKLGG